MKGLDMVSLERSTNLDRKAVQETVNDWICRLRELYSYLDTWVASIPNSTVERSDVRQAIEPLMTRFNVPAQAIPTYTVILETKRRVAFVPSVIWIIGANGRVNVTTNFRQHILLDIGGRSMKRNGWQLVVSDPNKVLIPFNKVAFQNLLRERK